ncbi:MAG: winged helix-turn-helix transcriptional regulator [Magnetospirillum sp.]|nr:winged helix-turn-helix transcriptional regulator [Magnetospirillum sp.]
MNARAEVCQEGQNGRSRPAADSPEIMLGLLNAIAESGERSQRSLSAQLGVALGLANAYLARCVKKGLIKISQVPPNRYAYYLTPQGFREKSRLTSEYLSQSLNLFRLARHQFSDLLAECQRRGWSRVVLWGVGDVAEVALLCLLDHPVQVIGVVDPSGRSQSFRGHPVASDLSGWPTADAVLLTDLDDPQGSYDRLLALLPEERVLAPRVLGVVRRPPDTGEAGA